ncbi:MAG: ABC transporter permease [Acholeplasmataceae bacterium]
MKLAFAIAWRFLASAKRQTLIIILGIAVGVSVQVFIGSLIGGLQDDLVDTTIGQSSHITLKHADEDVLIKDYEDKVETIESTIDDLVVASPVIDLGGILENGDTKKEVLLRGFDFERADRIYRLDEKLTENSRLPEEDDEIALGIGLMEELGVSVGDTIDLDIFAERISLTVVGSLDFNVRQTNRTWGLGTIEALEGIIEAEQATSIEMQIGEVFEAETLADRLDRRLSDDDLTTTDWMSENQELLSGLQGQSISSLMIQVFVIISVVLGISSVLAITVMQKSKQIGILKAMGIQNRDASLVFLCEGFILGIFGAIGGVLLGLGLSYAFQTFALNPDGTPVVPLTIDSGFILLSALIALVASTLASLTPAIRSSKLTVIEVIRNA